jgi:hypothetical protein
VCAMLMRGVSAVRGDRDDGHQVMVLLQRIVSVVLVLLIWLFRPFGSVCE